MAPSWKTNCSHLPTAHIAHPTPTNILNPAEMDDVAATDACIQCHSQGRPRVGLIEGKAYDWRLGTAWAFD